MRRSLWVLVAVAAVMTMAGAMQAKDVGFPEDFSLARDRNEALKQLIPGTEDYYYYNCLNCQNTGKFEEVPKLLKLWIERHGRTGRVEEIENRQALLGYAANPQAALDLIRQRLGLHFNHQKETMNQQTSLPTALNAQSISREAFSMLAYSRHPQSLDGFADSALEWLASTPLSPQHRRNLLSRLKRPDLPNLPQLVLDDLRFEHSGGFGSMPIHNAMLLSQLDELLKLAPGMLNEHNMVHAYITKLRPSDDTNWRQDPKERQAYLDRLWEFVSRLAPVHNSLKACVLYHRLVHDRAMGVYDKDRFMTYIKLPRNVHYINPRYMEPAERRGNTADLNANFEQFAHLVPVGGDESLVRGYLMKFFVEEDSYKPYMEYISDAYLKEVFAETKIVNGIGDMEQWYSMLSPQKYQELKDRIDLDFAEQNKTLFAPDEDVSLDVNVKNIKTLLVKVYQINAVNYLRAMGKPVDTDINLDGLVANLEKTCTYDDPPLRRVRRHFDAKDFPVLKQKGTYVVEFIGGGKSSRALINKGKLQYLVRTSVAGQVFTVADQDGRQVMDARLWLAGHEYQADKDGRIVVPFSNAPGEQQVILVQPGKPGELDFATLDRVRQEAETYALHAGIHVERESLLRRKEASVIVRPGLYLNGMSMPLAVLEDVSLVITSTDLEGVNTTQEAAGFKLAEDSDTVYKFQVPENLARIAFTLKAKVQNLSQGKKVDLAAGNAFDLNAIDRTEKVEDLHLNHAGGKYYVDVLDKTGLPKASRPVAMVFRHHDFNDEQHVSLQTDKVGRVALGDLKDIDWIRAAGPEGTERTWFMPRDSHSLPGNIGGKAGQALCVPYMASQKTPTREELSLLEVRGGTFVKDRFESLKIQDGFVVVQDLPAGDYILTLKDAGRQIRIRLTEGVELGGYYLGASRYLQVSNVTPLQIVSAVADKDNLKITLANASPNARVHVTASRFMPEYPILAGLDRLPFAEPAAAGVSKAESYYLSGRNIGDEYRYILDRRYAHKLPGNMLARPSLLLNPWAIRKTETGQQEAQLGDEYRSDAAMRPTGWVATAGGVGAGRGGAAQNYSNLEFLPAPAVVLANLRADEKGVITVSRKDLGEHQMVQIVAEDPLNTVYREVTLEEVKLAAMDLRLDERQGLDPRLHFTERKQITVAPPGQDFVIADIASSRIERYDTVGRMYSLYVTLTRDATLTEFSFVTRWDALKPEQKQELYSKYACHELNFFLYKKDPAFFEKVVAPYLKNKKDKTFMDRFLTGEDLSGYLKPWAHAQLNTAERILLARRIKDEQAATARHVRDLYDLIPPDVDRFNHLFATALKGNALDASDSLGLDRAREQFQRLRELKSDEKGAVALTADIAPKAEAPASPPAPSVALAKAGESIEAEKELTESARDAAKDKMAAGKPMAARRAANGAAAVGYKKRVEENRLDLQARKQVRQFYRKLDKTEEFVENNYYHLPIENQNAGLITVNAFWKDYAAHDGKTPFVSTNLAEASHNFAEMMLALAVTDLPFEAPKLEKAYEGAKLTLKPGGTTVVYHREIKETRPAEAKTPILVSQNFFRLSDRYIHVNNEKLDKYVTDEFLVQTVYGCQVVVTNPTSSPQKLDILLQIPRGAMPVMNTQQTRSVHIDLQPYNTQTIEFHFYFPLPGEYPHYPVHVSKNETLIAFCPPVALKAVDKLSKIDTTSWDYISQNGTGEQVVSFLKEMNVDRVNLDKIAFRMRDKAFFEQVLGILSARHVYNNTLWSYGVLHNNPQAVREFLQFADGFVSQCGLYIDSPLLTIDPVIRKSYQHMEYSPLVNARAHKLGKNREILNGCFWEQYQRLMKVLTYRGQLDNDDLMAVTYYMLLQDRVEEAQGFFARVDAGKLATRIQHDYFTAYLDFYTDDHKVARGIAAKYQDYPVDRWRNVFAAVTAQLDEADGKGTKVVDKLSRDQQQSALAMSDPVADFKVEARQVVLTHRNLKQVRVNYYLMDIELLFSRNPFVQQYSGQFSFIQPNQTHLIDLADQKSPMTFELPKAFHSSNVMVEIEAAGVKKSQAYYSNSLSLEVAENYGQVKVTNEKTGKDLPKVYVKVYARMRDGSVKFYKDGYTDLRGRFDYASLNTDELGNVEKFSVLVLSETDGAVVREVSPPKQ